MKKTAFTLMELLVTIFVISVLSFVVLNNVLAQIPELKTQEDIKTLEQALKQARSSAIKISSTVKVDFSTAARRHESYRGGEIKIKKTDGTVISSIYLNENVLYNTSKSSIENSVVWFDFRGQPVDESGLTNEFTTNNNKITISYYDGDAVKASRSLRITPLTGALESE